MSIEWALLDGEAEFARNAWWLHDAQWFAAVARLGDVEMANRANLEAMEKSARGAVLRLRRQGVVEPPKTVEELTAVFRLLWRLFFPLGMYEETELTSRGDEAFWVGSGCRAYDQVKRAGRLGEYRCGCAAFRDGVARGLGVAFEHEIVESLVAGDGRCVVRYALRR